MKRVLYLILKKDMIKKLSNKSFGTQFIDSVMNAFDMPTKLTENYLKDNEDFIKVEEAKNN